MTAFLEAALRRALGNATLRIVRTEGVSGGCIHQARRVQTTDGDFFAKWSDDCASDIFVREADGLRAMRSATASLTVPEVVAASETAEGQPAFLILEYLRPARSSAGDEERFGRGLAELHRSSAAGFGFPVASYCGSTRQDNSPRDSWPAFYRDCRLTPLLRALDEHQRISDGDARLYQRLTARLGDLLPASSAPSLIHGDLWAGNVLWTDRGPALVDPACAYTDREMEFGISTLFGGVSDRAMAAYEEAWPLPSGWRERNPLYQLYHLLNHALLFGGSYAEDARLIARRYAG